jgi:hypothetical protein
MLLQVLVDHQWGGSEALQQPLRRVRCCFSANWAAERVAERSNDERYGTTKRNLMKQIRRSVFVTSSGDRSGEVVLSSIVGM